MTDFPVSDRNRIRRLPKRAAYDRDAVYGIVDEALVCHVGFVIDEQPYVIPTIHARHEDILYLHGAPASRLLKHAKARGALCVTVTLLDGLVLARSAFHHSMNYRSAVLFGVGREVTDDEEKLRALATLTEHVARGRWADARQPTPRELKATTVVAMTIESASAKVRQGPPVDDEEDVELPIWAGVLPLALTPQTPVPDSRLAAGVETPAYVRRYSRRG
jgi:nitroimidazol reductase NimA-like FMN-containing flavoprotein (pyridoxamine 5'-phosphate oxidase superfamily)